MKLFTKIAAAAAVLVAGSAGAMADGGATGTVNVTATIIAACTINTLQDGTPTTALDFSTATHSASIAPGTKSNASGTLVGDCNTPTHLTLTTTSGASFNSATTADATHQNFFAYDATATYDTLTTPILHASGSAVANTSVGAGPNTTSSHGNITVSVTALAPLLSLVQGGYSDALVVALTAN